MVLVREGEPTPTPAADRVDIEWIDVDLDARPAAETRSTRALVLRSAAMVLGAASAVFVIVLAASARTGGSEATTPSPTAPTPASGVRPSVVEQPDPVEALPSTPLEWLADRMLVSVDGEGRLRLRRLDRGVDITAGTHSSVVPPLPEHVLLLGAPNRTWLVDTERLERSGELSNTVRLVRLGEGLDSFGFISTGADDRTEFFVGSFWGPAASGLDAVDGSTDVITVADAGIIAADAAGTSAVLRPTGFESLSARFGRVVAASPTTIAGIHCDAAGRCVGRVGSWDGDAEQQVDAELLARPVVTISPDGRYLVSGGTSTWDVLDLEDGARRSFESAVDVDGPTAWAPDSTGLFLVADSSVLALLMGEPDVGLSRVDTAGVAAGLWPNADLASLIVPDEGAG